MESNKNIIRCETYHELKQTYEPEEQFDKPIPLLDIRNKPIPYPVELLPEIVKNAVVEYHAFGQQPLPIVACSALANMSLVCQGLANIARDERLISPSSMNFLVIALSGERKTASDNHFKTAPKYWMKQKTESLQKDIKQNNALHNAWQARKKGILSQIERADESKVAQLKNQLVELEQQEPSRIIKPTLYYEDTTTEALAHNLAIGWKSTAIWSEEAGTVIGGNGMSQDNVTKFTTLLNRLWDGNDHYVNRRTSDSFEISGVRLTCSLMMQPIIFTQLITRCNNVCRGNGFLPRCLIINPPSTMGERPYKEPPASMSFKKIFDNRIFELLDKPLPLDEHQKLRPETIYLKPQTKTLWIDFYNEVEAQLRKGGEFSDIRDFASKAAENAARLACIFHVFCEGESNLISIDNMQRAAGIIAWHLQEIKQLIGNYEIPQNRQDAIDLCNWLIAKKCSQIRLADILQFAPYVLRDKSRRDAAIQILIEHNHLKIKERGNIKFVVLNHEIMGDHNV